MSDNSATPGSVGLVKTQVMKIPLPPGGFVLENRETLPELTVAYETYGTLSPGRDNVIYICHALSGDAHVAGYYDEADPKPGWWDAMVGPGKGIDTNRFYVICSNILGGCMGTTGPSSLNPRTGKPYGSVFPSITIGDIVNVQHALLKELGVRRLTGVIGGSFGGMQVLEWAIRYPGMVERPICIASALSLSTQALAFDIVGRNAILADPAWAAGDYYENRQVPAHGLAQARMIGHITYLSSGIMDKKFGREKKEAPPSRRFSTPFQIESYLNHQGANFVNRFDANSYLHITEAMDTYDRTENIAGGEEIFKTIHPAAKMLVVALSSDWLFPPEQSLEITNALIRANRHVSYCLLRSPYGHDAFLVEIEHLTEVVRAFLESPLGPATDPRTIAVAPESPAPGAGDREYDYERIETMIKPGARVLDLGCGDGQLLAELIARKQASGLGLDINLENMMRVIRRGLDVIQCNIDEGLGIIPDRHYDYAILSQTLQVIHKPRLVLQEILRVAREGIISFPNFGNWRHRLHLGFRGLMPRSATLPFEWFDTPNIHLSTVRDFQELCRLDGIRITDIVGIPHCPMDALFMKMGMHNLGADRVIIKITKDNAGR